MRTKTGLMIVLASFLAAASLSAAMAVATSAGDSVTDGTSLAPVVPSATPALPACSNGVDDDGDGLVDTEDDICTTPEWTSEEVAAPAEATAPAPIPAPAPAPAPANNGAPEGEQPSKKNSKKVVEGESIGGDAAKRKRGGATVNESLGDSSGGSRSDGGVKAPSATGQGDQPLEGDGDGGAQFNPTGAPTLGNPTTTIAAFGPAPIGVPNFIIDSFEIPPFLLPIYQACGTEYGIPWEVLASINKIETGFGTNLNVSTAGAMGWMQFLPSSWEAFGVDANGDGKKDPYNPVDAICAAANYLEIAGAKENLYDAIFAYNHADWYVQEVLLYARAYGRLPSDLVGSLTGLTEGAHFPIAADARYADEVGARASNAEELPTSSPTRRGINVFAAPDSPVVAVNDGIVRKLGKSEKLGNYVVLEDTYGNRYTYAKLGNLVRNERLVVMPSGKEKRLPVESENLRPRLRALPGRVEDDGLAHAESRPGSGEGKLQPDHEISSGNGSGEPGKGNSKGAKKNGEAKDAKATDASAPTPEPEEIRGDGRIRVGSKVIAGTVLARVASRGDEVDPHINFSIRPAGKGAPRIDPKPILDGWKLLEATAIYRAKGKNPFAARLSGAGVLLLSKEALIKRVLADEGLEIYGCGEEDIAAGAIDRRVLAMLSYLRSKGFSLTVTSLRCGHGIFTSSGNVSEHSTGDAVDIAAINGLPVIGNQGPGSSTNKVIGELLRLQGTMHPHQVISLEDFPGPVSFPLGDHADHIHVGYHSVGENPLESRFSPLLKPNQWERLVNRLGQIENPEVAIRPSSSSLPADEPDGGNAAD
jgi:hypothetical protein